MAPKPLYSRRYGNLTAEVYATKQELGQAAAARAAEGIRQVINEKGQANLVFATGASQFEFVGSLPAHDVDWQRVQVFHLDEYQHMSATHPASFRLWLATRIEQPLKPGRFFYIEGDAPDSEAECARYAALLKENPIDIGFVGIGENGHIAFNDPPVADFNDPHWVKVVELDDACRQQQYGEGWFPTFESVPTHALTLTVPAIMSFRRILSIVPDARKAKAVRDALLGPVSTECPASILRTHPNVTLFLDQDSASLLPN